jgi:hypothetical protein
MSKGYRWNQVIVSLLPLSQGNGISNNLLTTDGCVATNLIAFLYVSLEISMALLK